MVTYVKPTVRLIAETKVDELAIGGYLEEIGAEDWETDAHSDAEALSEIAGRLCYRSFAPGLNPNVTKVREGNANYLGNILQQAHGSVLEHGSVSFIFHNVSRVFTHELVRHRIASYSQESLRYVRLDALKAYFPEIAFGDETIGELYDSLPADHETKHGIAREDWIGATRFMLATEFRRSFEEAEDRQKMMSSLLCLNDCRDFAVKKKLTSAMRRMAPDGLSTSILYTNNHRVMRDVIWRRTSRGAEEEIRVVFARVFEIVEEKFPAFYQDAHTTTVDGVLEVTFDNLRV